MTTIMTSLQMPTQSATAAGSDNSLSGQISQLTAQIANLTQQLKELANRSGSPEEKLKEQEQIQTQIKILQAQLAQLQHEQAEQASQKKQAQTLPQTGVNRPGTEHQIDIYI